MKLTLENNWKKLVEFSFPVLLNQRTIKSILSGLLELEI